MNTLGRIGLVSLAFSALCALAPIQAFAQDSELTLEEVVVTARKVEETSQSVPVAITAITKELTNSTVRDLTDLNGFAPNVQIGEDGGRGGGGASITIRGISPTRTDDNSFDSPIGVMIDGIYLGSLAGQVLENFDIERVEVLRGPQGTLFGKNTVGGVLHVIRSRPTGEFGLRAKVTAGSDGLVELRGVLNTPIVEDKLAAKLFVTQQEDDGFMKNITIGGNVSAKDYRNYGVTLLATPTDRFEATFTTERFLDNSDLNAYHTNYNTAPGVIAPPTDPNESDYSGGFLACNALMACRRSLDTPSVAENDKRNLGELDVDAHTLTMRYELNSNMELVSVTGYREMYEYRIFDFDASAAPFITIERFNDYDQLSSELRLDGQFNNVSFSTGAYYWNSEFEQDWITGDRFWATLFAAVAYDPAAWGACQAGALAPIYCDTGLNPAVEPGGTVTQILYETQETTSYALFAQVDWDIVPDLLTLTVGARWTREEKDFIAGQAYLTNVARQFERNFPEYADLSNSWTEVSPKVGLTYQATDDSILYGSYSEGFHSGGFFGVNQNTRDFIRDQYDPEYAKSFEVGYKSTWMNNRLRFNLTLFHNKFTDKQEQSIQVDPDTRTVATVFDNVADATYQGVELETEYLINQYVRIFFNYGYLDASYNDFETDINASDGMEIIQDASHLTPRNAPESTIGIGGTISFPLGDGSFEIYGKYARVSEIETNLLNTPLARIDDRPDVTASVGYYTDTYSVVAYGRNLTDEQYETFFPVGSAPPLFAIGSVNRPRTVGIELSFEF